MFSFAFNKLTVAKKVYLSNSFSNFLYKKLFQQVLLILYNCKCIFGDATQLCQHIPLKAGGVKVKGGLAPSVQTQGSLQRTP
jgi:hypothetical protein